jgi:hypothetical protein
MKIDREFFSPAEMRALYEALDLARNLIPVARVGSDVESVARSILFAARDGDIDPMRLSEKACANWGVFVPSKSFH